ncbi:MAG: cell division protein ZapA [Desulfocapsa sp.]|nr:MAG: cell division protein ZapA [Desulfocapsa sp.]
MERLVRFELIGHEFSFYTSAPEEEVDEIIQMVTNLIKENSGSGTSGSIPVGKVAVLASLNIASQYVELKRDFAKYKQETDVRLLRLGGQIAEQLSEE